MFFLLRKPADANPARSAAAHRQTLFYQLLYAGLHPYSDSTEDIEDCAFQNCPLKAISSKNNALRKENGLCYWKDCLLSADSCVTSAHIKDGTKVIGEGAFVNCCDLAELTIPASVAEIREYAFRGCSALTKTSIPEGINELAQAAFNGCVSLTEVKLQSTLKTIKAGAFEDCVKLTDI